METVTSLMFNTHQYSDVEPLLLRKILRDFENTVQSRHYQILLLSRLRAAPLCRRSFTHVYQINNV